MLTIPEAESLLLEWVAVVRDRDDRIRAALAAGLTVSRVSQLTGVARSTIYGVIAQENVTIN